MIHYSWNKGNKISKRNILIGTALIFVFVIIYSFLVGSHIIQFDVKIGYNPIDLRVIPDDTFSYDQSMLFVFVPFTLIILLIMSIKKEKNAFFLFAFALNSFLMLFYIPLFSEYGMGFYRLILFVVITMIGFSVSLEYIIMKTSKKYKIIILIVMGCLLLGIFVSEVIYDYMFFMVEPDEIHCGYFKSDSIKLLTNIELPYSFCKI